MGNVIRIQTKVKTIGGITPSGIAYQQIQSTGQTTSYNSFDEGDQIANGVLTRTQPANPIHIAELDYTQSNPLLFLKNNNTFGNKDRYTDINGLQVYGDDYIIDHLFGLGFNRIFKTESHNNALINSNASTDNGFSDWFTPNLEIINNISDHERSDVMNYAPFNLLVTFGTSTTRSNFNTNCIVMLQDGRTTSIAKTTQTRFIYFRKHF